MKHPDTVPHEEQRKRSLSGSRVKTMKSFAVTQIDGKETERTVSPGTGHLRLSPTSHTHCNPHSRLSMALKRTQTEACERSGTLHWLTIFLFLKHSLPLGSLLFISNFFKWALTNKKTNQTDTTESVFALLLCLHVMLCSLLLYTLHFTESGVFSVPVWTPHPPLEQMHATFW